MDIIYNIDNIILTMINSLHSPILDKIMIFITRIGNLGAVWIILSIILLMNKRYRRVGVISILALIIAAILGEGILKHIFERPRPCIDIPQSEMLIKKPITFSFPSGHSASSFAVVTVFVKNFKKYSIPFVILAILIAFSRLYLYVHFPSDVLCGILLGVFSGILAMCIFEKYRLNELKSK